MAAKTAPVDADTLPLTDSADGNKTKKITWANIKAALKTWLDGLYAAVTHSHTKSQITDFPASLPASDVPAWAKAASKPIYTASEVGAAASGHPYAGNSSNGKWRKRRACGYDGTGLPSQWGRRRRRLWICFSCWQLQWSRRARMGRGWWRCRKFNRVWWWRQRRRNKSLYLYSNHFHRYLVYYRRGWNQHRRN